MSPDSVPWLLAALATLVALISNATRILEFLGYNPKVKLICRGHDSPYSRDPLVHEFYEHWVNEDPTLVAAGKTATGTYWADNSRRQQEGLNRFLQLTVENAGSVVLKNVQLEISGLVAVRHSVGYPDEPVEAKAPLLLGDMMPKSRKVFYAWCRTEDGSPARVTAVHEAGHATVVVLDLDAFAALRKRVAYGKGFTLGLTLGTLIATLASAYWLLSRYPQP